MLGGAGSGGSVTSQSESSTEARTHLRASLNGDHELDPHHSIHTASNVFCLSRGILGVFSTRTRYLVCDWSFAVCVGVSSLPATVRRPHIKEQQRRNVSDVSSLFIFLQLVLSASKFEKKKICCTLFKLPTFSYCKSKSKSFRFIYISSHLNKQQTNNL